MPNALDMTEVSEDRLREHFEAVMNAGGVAQASKEIGAPRVRVRRDVERFLRRYAAEADWARFDEYIANKERETGKKQTLGTKIPRRQPPPQAEQLVESGGDVENQPPHPGPVVLGKVEHDEGTPVIRRNRHGVRRWLLTVAQNNTRLHAKFWENLTAFSDFIGAEIMVARCTYDIQNYRDSKAKAIAGQSAREIDHGLWYPDEIAPYVVDVGDRRALAPDLVFVADNMLPTVAEPLAGMDTYTGAASTILPHPQIAMRSIPTMRDQPAKFLYTTGAVTLRNYLPLKTGNKASFHHCYGALLVEKDEASEEWWCRQINAEDASGSFYDLDVMVADGKVTEGHRPEAVNWGDIHCAALSDIIIDGVWGEGGMVDALRPHLQAFHDSLDFRARSHHELGNWVRMLERHRDGRGSVEQEMLEVAEFLKTAHRDYAISLVVNSNHDRHFDRWLNEASWKTDPENAPFYLRAAAARAEAVLNHDDTFNTLEWAARRYGCPEAVRFLKEDESYRVCEHAGGIELGLHGDRGANGARGTEAGLKKLPFKANIGDKHRAGIFQGLYVAGVMPDEDAFAYAKGPGAWSRSIILTHSNGKRQIVTMRGTRWRA